MVQDWRAPVSGNWLGNGNWTPAGKPTASTAAVISVAGTYTVTIGNGAVAQSLTIGDAGATVLDTGSLQLNGALDITAGQFVLDYGKLSGATIATGPGGAFVVEGGTLSTSIVQGTLTLAADAFTTLDAVTFTGTGGTGLATINVLASGSELALPGSATLDNAVVNLGASDLDGSGAGIDEENTTGTLTLGTNLTIDQSGPLAALDSNGVLVNDGVINADSAGGTFSLYAPGGLINDGTITVTNGATLLLESAVTAAVIDSIDVSGGTLEIAGQVTGGTIVSASPAIALGTGGTLSAVSVDGTLSIDGAATLAGAVAFAGLDGTGGGVLDFAGTSFQTATGSLNITGSSGLDNVTINFGYGGHLYVSDFSGPFTLGAATVLNAGASNDENQVDAFGTLVNQGTINLAQAGGNLTIYATSFTNTGVINVSGGGTLEVTGAGSSAFAASVNVTDGTLRLDAAFTGTTALALQAGETLALDGGGTLAADVSGAGTLRLDSSDNYTFDAGTSIEATLAAYGVEITLAPGLALTLAKGATWIEEGNIVGPASSSVVIDGTLLGGGSFGVHVVDAGLIDVAAGQAADFGLDDARAVITTGTLTGAGTAYVGGPGGLLIDAGATLTIDHIVETGGPVVFAKSVAHSLTADQTWTLDDSRLSGGGGNVFTNGGTFSSSGTAVSTVGVDFINQGQIEVGSGTLSFIGPLSNSGTIVAGGGHLIVAGRLAGTGTLDIGAIPMGHDAPVSATAELHAAAATQTIDFITATGTLLLDSPGRVASHIAGFSAGDTISLTGIQETSFTYAGGILSVLDGAGTVARLHFTGAYTQQSFSVVETAGNVVITHT